ncbi:uncharacterized protein [Procambarus clarkii]|uniref:uncharacterized protein n=1 Tax=Procambarus clarkii TaxID=6728 RepID=UPI003742C1C2
MYKLGRSVLVCLAVVVGVQDFVTIAATRHNAAHSFSTPVISTADTTSITAYSTPNSASATSTNTPATSSTSHATSTTFFATSPASSNTTLAPFTPTTVPDLPTTAPATSTNPMPDEGSRRVTNYNTFCTLPETALLDNYWAFHSSSECGCRLRCRLNLSCEAVTVVPKDNSFTCLFSSSPVSSDALITNSTTTTYLRNSSQEIITEGTVISSTPIIISHSSTLMKTTVYSSSIPSTTVPSTTIPSLKYLYTLSVINKSTAETTVSTVP